MYIFAVRFIAAWHCSAVNQFPRSISSFFTPLKRRMPAGKSALRRAEVGRFVCEPTHGAQMEIDGAWCELTRFEMRAVARPRSC
jgi:hypothetical protein